MLNLPHLRLTWACPDCGKELSVESVLYHERYDKDELYKELHHLIGDHLHHSIVETVDGVEVDRKTLELNFHNLSTTQKAELIGYYKKQAIKGDDQ